MEIAARCQHLIELLADQTDRDPKLVERWRGPLRTTFLLAMSTPMLVLPMERLFKPVLRKAGVADDSKLDEAAGDRVRATFADGRPFHEAEFYEAKAWSYIAATQKFSVAEVWPSAIFDQLDTPEAFEAAAAAPTADILECLRNALSHGGVAYLDARGRQSNDATNMLGFASYPAYNRRDELRILRISVDGYERFLAAWSKWLSDSGAEEKLAREGPGWFDDKLAAE
jgi:hypothetical protein